MKQVEVQYIQAHSKYQSRCVYMCEPTLFLRVRRLWW